MLANNVKTVRNDMKTLLRDAQELFREATIAGGDKAEELRQRGISLLEAAGAKAQELQAAAIESGKEAAKSTDEFVHEHPWKAVGIAAGVGLLVGLLIGRR